MALKGKNARPITVTHADMLDEWDYEKNGDKRPEDYSAGSGVRVWRRCRTCHGGWETRIGNWMNGQRCPYCSGRKVLRGANDLATRRPDIAEQWHPARNGELTPQDVTEGSNRRAWWMCQECGAEWATDISNRTILGTGCPVCGKRRADELRTKPLEEKCLSVTHAALSEQWNRERNGDVTPDDVTHSSTKAYWWRCPECGHEWRETLFARAKNPKTACPKCGHRLDGANN